MPGEHVGEESHGEREGPDDERGQQLDRRHQQVERLGHARREERGLEVRQAVVLHTHADEHRPRDDRQHQRVRHAGVGRHVRGRDDLEQVADPDEEDHGSEHGQVAHAVGADGWEDHLPLDEIDPGLGDVLQLARDGRRVSGRDEVDERGNHEGDQRDEPDLVEREGRPVQERVRPLDEVLDRREGDATPALLSRKESEMTEVAREG